MLSSGKSGRQQAQNHSAPQDTGCPPARTREDSKTRKTGAGHSAQRKENTPPQRSQLHYGPRAQDSAEDLTGGLKTHICTNTESRPRPQKGHWILFTDWLRSALRGAPAQLSQPDPGWTPEPQMLPRAVSWGSHYFPCDKDERAMGGAQPQLPPPEPRVPPAPQTPAPCKSRMILWSWLSAMGEAMATGAGHPSPLCASRLGPVSSGQTPWWHLHEGRGRPWRRQSQTQRDNSRKGRAALGTKSPHLGVLPQ